jgi:1,4-dihydroxy-2-naphthoyl-CoA hydrolase
MSIWHGGAFPFDVVEGFPEGTLIRRLGIEFLEAGDDWLKGRMPVDGRTRQPYGVLHGGASVSLAETLASVAGGATLDPAKAGVAGMEINANHIRPVREGWVYGVARQESAGRTTQIWTIRIATEDDKPVCLSRCTLAVVPAWP